MKSRVSEESAGSPRKADKTGAYERPGSEDT